MRGQLRNAYETKAADRSEEQKKLLAQNPSVNINPGNLYQYIAESKPELAKFDTQIKEIRAKKPVEEFLRALTEPANHVPETKLFHRGDHEQPKQTINPAPLSVTASEGEHPQFPLNDESLPSTGRRLAFARWLTNGSHPLVARVIVNRVWLHHFGKGLVETPADFGKLGVPPSNPELLDWLADEFVRQGWSLKKLHRLIMTSTVWRQSAEHSGQKMSTPFARRSLIRLDAETIRDRMLAASGQLDRKQFGTPVQIKEDDTGQIVVDGGQTRRSLYIKARRSRPVAMMKAFDAPVMQTNCEVRQSSTVATQSLMLMNGEFILAQAAKLAERAAKEAAPVDSDLLETLSETNASSDPWRYGFGRFDKDANAVVDFTALPHWTGTQWQGGEKLPDEKLGYVLLNATGGHPDIPGRDVVRRLVVPYSGTIDITGSLSHGSPNGNGIRSRIVSSRAGKLGEWTAFNSTTETPVSAVHVEAGEFIDFVTDANGTHTSDSFKWPVRITWTNEGLGKSALASDQSFYGPPEPQGVVAGRVIRAWQLALCRNPSRDELELAVRFANEQINAFRSGETSLPEKRTPAQQALVNICQSLFSSNEFLYVD